MHRRFKERTCWYRQVQGRLKGAEVISPQSTSTPLHKRPWSVPPLTTPISPLRQVSKHWLFQSLALAGSQEDWALRGLQGRPLLCPPAVQRMSCPGSHGVKTSLSVTSWGAMDESKPAWCFASSSKKQGKGPYSGSITLLRPLIILTPDEECSIAHVDQISSYWTITHSFSLGLSAVC